MQIKVKKITDQAKLPEYSHDTDAGMDLYSTENYTLEPQEVKLFNTGIAVEIPAGYTAFAKDKSSMAVDHHIHTLAGVIDAGYRGEWKIPLINLGQESTEIEQGQNIVQAVILPIPEVQIEETKELSDSERGKGGFGSTGKF